MAATATYSIAIYICKVYSVTTLSLLSQNHGVDEKSHCLISGRMPTIYMVAAKYVGMLAI